MASLLHWLGSAVKRVENTVHNDVVKPIQRDVVAPVQHAAAATVHQAQGAVAQVNPADNGRTYNTVMQRGAQYAPQRPASVAHQATHNGATNAFGSALRPVAHFATPAFHIGQQLGIGAYHVATLPVETARTATAELTHNLAATNAGIQRAGQGFNALKGLAQGTASTAYQLGESVNPSGGDVYKRQHTFKNPVAKAVFGSAPVPSMQKQYKDTKAAHGGAYAAGEALTTAIMDAAGAKGGAKTAVKVAEKAPVALDTPAVAELKAKKQATIKAMDTAKPSMMKNLVANVNSLDSQIKAIKEGGSTPVDGPIIPVGKLFKNESGVVPSGKAVEAPQIPARKPGSKLPKVETPQTQRQIPQESLQRPLSTSSAHNTPVDANTQFDPSQYVAEQTKLQDQAAKASNTGKLTQTKNTFRTKAIDALAPIEDPVIHAVGWKGALPLRNQLDRTLRADTIAGQYLHDNGVHKIIQSVPNTKAFDQYLIAKHAQELEAQGVKTGRNLAKDQQLIDSLAPQYEAHAQALSAYSQRLLDKTVEYGLIDKKTAEFLKQKYPNYVPFDRIFSDGEQAVMRGNGSGPASLSKQSVVQRIEGSDRQIQSPLQNILGKTHDVIAQGERNQSAKILTTFKDIPGNPLGLVPLRTTADVNARIDLYSQAKELRPAQVKLQQLLKTQGRWSRKLQSQLDQLNKKGLDVSLKAQQTKAEAPILSGNRDVLQGARTVLGKKNQPLLTSHAITGTVTTRQFTRAMTAGETKRMVNNLVNMPKPELERIKSQIATRENNLAPVMDKIEELRAAVEGVKNNRQALFDEAKLHSDAASRGKATISFLDNGVKNIYETSPEVSAAAKSLNKEQMNILGKILSYPTRLLRLGATGLNVGFAGANVVKDVSSSFINSEHPIRSSIANPSVFVDALAAAFNHGSKQYSELVREGAGGTSFDIARGSAKDTVKRIRAGKSAASKVLYTVTRPGELLRAAEDTIGRSEEYGRAMQYYGNKQAALAKGATTRDAVAYGADAARNNTVNFARAGEYGRVLNSVLPYFNAGLQGSRVLLRNLKERPVQTGTKIAITAFLPVATTTAWNLSDPKRREAYNDISDYEKQNNIIIIPPNPHKDANGRWNVIKIPVSQEIANLNNVVRNGVEAMAKDQSFNFPALAGNLAGSATSLNTQNGRQLVGQITPQAIKPGLESLTNQNLYTGNKIVPDSMKNLDPKDQIGSYTSGTARMLGSALGQSPLMIDNAIRTSTGGLGQNIVHLSDQLLAKTGAIKPSDVKGRPLLPSITDRFSGAQGKPAGDVVGVQVKQVTDKFKKLPGFQAMSPQDKALAINRITNDANTAFFRQYDAKNNTGPYAQKAANSKALSKRQAGLLNGTTDISSYLTTQPAKSPGTPKIPKATNTAYDPKSNTWTQTNSTTGRVTKITADGSRTVVTPGIGAIKNARPDYVSTIRSTASKYGVDTNAVLAVAAMEGLGGGVGDNGTSYGPFQLHQGGALPQGATQAWAESPAGIDYALQQISKVAKGKTGADAVQAIVNAFEKPANPNNEIAGALAIYGGKSATLGSGTARSVKVASSGSSGTSSGTKSTTGKIKGVATKTSASAFKLPKVSNPKVKTPHLRTHVAKATFKAPKVKAYKTSKIAVHAKNSSLSKLLNSA